MQTALLCLIAGYSVGWVITAWRIVDDWNDIGDVFNSFFVAAVWPLVIWYRRKKGL